MKLFDAALSHAMPSLNSKHIGLIVAHACAYRPSLLQFDWLECLPVPDSHVEGVEAVVQSTTCVSFPDSAPQSQTTEM